jgi:hypothetical protein
VLGVAGHAVGHAAVAQLGPGATFAGIVRAAVLGEWVDDVTVVAH